jgi:hypothetical protein
MEFNAKPLTATTTASMSQPQSTQNDPEPAEAVATTKSTRPSITANAGAWKSVVGTHVSTASFQSSSSSSNRRTSSSSRWATAPTFALRNKGFDNFSADKSMQSHGSAASSTLGQTTETTPVASSTPPRTEEAPARPVRVASTSTEATQLWQTMGRSGSEPDQAVLVSDQESSSSSSSSSNSPLVAPVTFGATTVLSDQDSAATAPSSPPLSSLDAVETSDLLEPLLVPTEPLVAAVNEETAPALVTENIDINAAIPESTPPTAASELEETPVESTEVVVDATTSSVGETAVTIATAPEELSITASDGATELDSLSVESIPANSESVQDLGDAESVPSAPMPVAAAWGVATTTTTSSERTAASVEETVALESISAPSESLPTTALNEDTAPDSFVMEAIRPLDAVIDSVEEASVLEPVSESSDSLVMPEFDTNSLVVEAKQDISSLSVAEDAVEPAPELAVETEPTNVAADADVVVESEKLDANPPPGSAANEDLSAAFLSAQASLLEKQQQPYATTISTEPERASVSEPNIAVLEPNAAVARSDVIDLEVEPYEPEARQAEKPLLSLEIQPDVTDETIKGAALAGLALSIVTGNDLPTSIGLVMPVVAYLSMTQGFTGELVRTVGDITWNFTTFFVGNAGQMKFNSTDLTKTLMDVNAAGLGDAMADILTATQETMIYARASTSAWLMEQKANMREFNDRKLVASINLEAERMRTPAERRAEAAMRRLSEVDNLFFATTPEQMTSPVSSSIPEGKAGSDPELSAQSNQLLEGPLGALPTAKAATAATADWLSNEVTEAREREREREFAAAIEFEAVEQTTDQNVVLKDEESQEAVIPALEVIPTHEPSALGDSPQEIIAESQAIVLPGDAEESTVGDVDASLDHLQVFALTETATVAPHDSMNVKSEHVESGMELEGGRRRAPYTKQYIVFESPAIKRAYLERKHRAESPMSNADAELGHVGVIGSEQPVVVALAEAESTVDAPSDAEGTRLETKTF